MPVVAAEHKERRSTGALVALLAGIPLAFGLTLLLIPFCTVVSVSGSGWTIGARGYWLRGHPVSQRTSPHGFCHVGARPPYGDMDVWWLRAGDLVYVVQRGTRAAELNLPPPEELP